MGGFIKKTRAPVRNNRGGNDEVRTEGKENTKKKSYKDRNAKPVREGKRQFDKQSGTGRGKEISKNGAGGKGTWGTNPKNVAREEYNYDEDVFNSALNPKKKRLLKKSNKFKKL